MSVMLEVLPIIIPNFKNYLHEQAAYNDCVTLDARVC